MRRTDGLGVAVGWDGGLVGAGIFCPPEQAEVMSVIARKITINHRYLDIFSSSRMWYVE